MDIIIVAIAVFLTVGLMAGLIIWAKHEEETAIQRQRRNYASLNDACGLKVQRSGGWAPANLTFRRR